MVSPAFLAGFPPLASASDRRVTDANGQRFSAFGGLGQAEFSAERHARAGADSRGRESFRADDQLYRRRHGEWPQALAELTPEYLTELPIDPFSNKPLIYGRRGQSFVLYSVGKDGQDSGGLFPPDGDPHLRFQNGDIDWDCERRGLTNTWPRKKP
ncbi:MAG TPA: hypothetical protein VFB96_14140 [Pirellulaceae bacterium]|nr:hypothetical protein [Pirellulaceae bacterium]